MYFANGFCYLRLFVAYNDAVGEVFDLDFICCRLGKFPLVRRVFGYLYSYATTDFYIPGLRAVSSNMYHVFPKDGVVKFSDMILSMLFSTARIGGIVDNNDNVIRVNQGVSTFVQLCETTLRGGR